MRHGSALLGIQFLLFIIIQIVEMIAVTFCVSYFDTPYVH